MKLPHELPQHPYTTCNDFRYTGNRMSYQKNCVEICSQACFGLMTIVYEIGPDLTTHISLI